MLDENVNQSSKSGKKEVFKHLYIKIQAINVNNSFIFSSCSLQNNGLDADNGPGMIGKLSLYVINRTTLFCSIL